MRKPSTAHRSRRAPPLKDSDYDHEISLVDHAAEVVTPQALSPRPGQQPEQPQQPTEQRPTSTIRSQPQSDAAAEQEQEPAPDSGEGPSSSQRAPARNSSPRRSASGASATCRRSKGTSKKAASQESLAGNAALPQLEITGEHLHRWTRISACGKEPQLTDSRTYATRRATTHPTRCEWRQTPQTNPRDRYRHTIRK